MQLCRILEGFRDKQNLRFFKRRTEQGDALRQAGWRGFGRLAERRHDLDTGIAGRVVVGRGRLRWRRWNVRRGSIRTVWRATAAASACRRRTTTAAAAVTGGRYREVNVES